MRHIWVIYLFFSIFLCNMVPKITNLVLKQQSSLNSVYVFLVRSFMELAKYIFTIPKVKCFLYERISQDPLEKFFRCQHQRGGTSDNPNVKEFCKNTQALRVINSACGDIPHGNCRGNNHTLDTEEENQPLPKRHYKRK